MASEKARVLSTNSPSEKHLNHDVFVLSPSSLQKLGIHLDSIQQGKAVNSHINDIHITSERASTNSDQTQLLKRSIGSTSSQSSMSETANLMKTSVFLSPTFETGNYNKEIKTNCNVSYKTDDMKLANNGHEDNDLFKSMITVENCKTFENEIISSCDDVENTNNSNNVTIQSVKVLTEPASTNTEIKSSGNSVGAQNYTTSVTDIAIKDNNAQTSLKSPQRNNKIEIQSINHEEKHKISSLYKGPLKDFVLVNLKGGSHTIINDNIPATKHKQNDVKEKTDDIQSSCSPQHNIVNNISPTNYNILQQKIAAQGIENPCGLDENGHYIVNKSKNCKTFKPFYKKRKHPQNYIIKQNRHSFFKNELEINVAESVGVLNSKEESFCACFDFGYLPSDSGTEYQHTHFDNKASVDSTLEELFVDKYDNHLFERVIKVHNEDVEHNVVNSTCISATCADICWKSLDRCSLFDEAEIVQDIGDNSTHIAFEEKEDNNAQKTVDNIRESVKQEAFQNVIDNNAGNCFEDIGKSGKSCTQKTDEGISETIIQNTFKDMKETITNDDLIPIYIVVSEDINVKNSIDECNKTEKSVDTEKESDEELSMPLSQFTKNIKSQQILGIASTSYSQLLEDNRDMKSLKRKRRSKETPSLSPSKYKKTYSSPKQPVIENTKNMQNQDDRASIMDIPPQDEINNTLSTSNLTFDISMEIISNDTKEGLEEHTKSDIVCGVCFEPIQKSSWIDHIEKKHNYIAWMTHEDQLNVEDQSVVNAYLQRLSKQIGGLKCNKCGVNRKYVKSFLQHVKNCEFEDSNDNDNGNKQYEICGVCKEKVEFKSWYDHIMLNHDYMAWKLDDPPLDLEDANAIDNHLDGLYKVLGQLICSKCGSHWKYKKKYLCHIKHCSKKEETESTTAITCGVCNEELTSDMWLNHIEKQHSYIAWKVGEPVIDINNDEELYLHLNEVIRILKKPLICSKCGLSRKYVKAYLNHFKSCNMNDAENFNEEDNLSIKDISSECNAETDVVCSVCEDTMKYKHWLNHLKTKHKYLAWRRGQQPLLSLDKQSIENHLQNISDEFGCLVCPYCGKSRKQAGAYQQHIIKCIAEQIQVHFEEDEYVLNGDTQETSCCGVCNENVLNVRWYEHIQKEHNYLAWKQGSPPLDIRNEQSIRIHLSSILAAIGKLKCSCGYSRKDVNVFSRHISVCQTKQNQTKDVANVNNNDTVTCALCSKEMAYASWSEHSLAKHYNLAWIKGTPPVDYSSNVEVERFLKIYKSKGFEFICKSCGATRASHIGFFAHVLTCNKTDEETDQYKQLCEICNSKYLCIYRYQHMRAHEIQQRKNEQKKLLRAKKIENELNTEPQENSNQRKAAQKAKKVLDLYNASEDLNTECTFSGDLDHDDSDDFQQEESESSSDESDISAASENVPRGRLDDVKNKKKKKIYEPFLVVTKTLPKDVTNPQAYLEKSYKDFCSEHMSIDNLYTQWKHGKYEFLDDTQMERYLPKLEESCNVSISNNEWSTYKRFESRYTFRVFSVFLGGTPQCLAWAPPSKHLSKHVHENYLAVATHKESLIPSVMYNELYTEPNLIQIWNFYKLKESSIPTLDLCIAHDFGIVWSMAWCPSGVRDVSNEGGCRLGLLATACSNGYVYIYSVPLPTTSSEVKFCKLKPVAELRLCSTEERKMFQPTKVYWSMKSGHSVVYVGYADGTVAFFDLNIASPILRCEENGVTILYPYHEDGTYTMPVQEVTRLGPLNDATDLPPVLLNTDNWQKVNTVTEVSGHTAIYKGRDDVFVVDVSIHDSEKTDISTYVCGSGYDGEALSVAAVSGVMMTDSTGPSPLLNYRELLCPAGAKFLPHWPSIHVAKSDLGVMQRFAELEFGGGECRRVGTAIKTCGCMCCGDIATVAPPFVRVIRAPHPILPECKIRVAAVVNMAPLKISSNKRVKDDMAVKIEPNTYDKVIRNYGLHFRSICKTEKEIEKTVKIENTELARFPLSDVMDFAFCPTGKLHTQLAIGTRSGLLFVIPAKHSRNQD